MNAYASAKISFRLVPNQQPGRVMHSLREFLQAHCPPGVRIELHEHQGCRGLVFDSHSVYMTAASLAIERAFQAAPVLIREGGSIPVVSTFRELLGVDTLLLGWGQNSDNLHSPNERFRLLDFRRGTAASAYLWHELASQAAAGNAGG